ncbi:MAG: transcription-repair coupling factor, partial [Oscillospiraceae bacterium]|nr:transcription-repair coupling factor [Oscillospiraceae bacterium]
MDVLSRAIAALPEVQELLLNLDAGRSPVAVSGLSPVHRALIAAALHHSSQRPIVLLCADEGEATRMAGDLQTLTEDTPALLFAREWQLRDRVSASHSFEQQRLGTLFELSRVHAPVLVATVDGMMQRTLPPVA